jgi:hypothetical protein
MVLSDHSLISLLFSLVKEYMFKMNLEILISHFENKNCFDVILKQFALEFLQLGFFPWERDYLLLCLAILSLVKVCHEVTFCFYGFQSERLEKKLEVLFEKKFLFLNPFFLSA